MKDQKTSFCKMAILYRTLIFLFIFTLRENLLKLQFWFLKSTMGSKVYKLTKIHF